MPEVVRKSLHTVPTYCTYIIMCTCTANNCARNDYYQWSPSDNLINNECILGEKEVFERKVANHQCRNGGEYERDISRTTCPCSREDYEWYAALHVIFVCTFTKW